MIQDVLVAVILAVTLFAAVRWVVRTLRGNQGCTCGCAGCPHASRKDGDTNPHHCGACGGKHCQATAPKGKNRHGSRPVAGGCGSCGD